jgi:hypothetical protein
MTRYPIVELRQYTLRPGQRDVLIDLFDREFVETQEAAGMGVLGQFRDLDAPDRFVWLRGFPDMVARADSLGAFYGGPVWREHGRAANATMVDSDDVLLLRPVAQRWAFPEPRAARPPVGQPAPASVVLATLCFADRPFDSGFTSRFERELYPALAAGWRGAIRLPVHRIRGEYVPGPAGTHRRACVRVVHQIPGPGRNGRAHPGRRRPELVARYHR